MKNKSLVSILLPIIVIVFGGVLLVALGWLAYAGISAIIESLFYQNAPQSMPQGTVRNISVLLFCMVILALLQTKIHNLVKAMLLVGPLTMVIIATTLQFYTNVWIFIGFILVEIIVSGFLIYRLKKPWFFYVSLVFSTVLGLLYAWPR